MFASKTSNKIYNSIKPAYLKYQEEKVEINVPS